MSDGLVFFGLQTQQAPSLVFLYLEVSKIRGADIDPDVP